MKNSLEVFKSSFEQVEELINKLEYRTIDIIQSKEEKEIRLKKSEKSLRDLWTTIQQTNTCTVRAPEGEERDRGKENIWINNS